LPLVGPPSSPKVWPQIPQDKFLYVANIGIDELAIDGTTGALTAISGSPVQVNNASFLTVDPSGSFLYADGNSGIFAVTIDSNTGALTLVAGSPFPLPINTNSLPTPTVLAVDSSGSFVYAVVDDYLGGWGPISYVAGYSIDTSNAGLTPIPNTPFFGNYFQSNNNNLSFDAIATSGGSLRPPSDQRTRETT
jgi:6-phosphogluconolactonase (cycloisomerase 2 family)